MNNLKMKTPIHNITKDMLNQLYFNDMMSLDQIGKHYGYADRQPIMRLFKIFGIKSRSKSEIKKLSLNNIAENVPTKEEVILLLGAGSLSAAAKKHNILRKKLTAWAELYDIKSKYFVNKEHRIEILNAKFDGHSPKEISIELGVDLYVVKYYRKNFKPQEYSLEQIQQKINLYKYDMNNQGLVKQIIYDDSSLYDSVMRLAEDHYTESDKFTEKLYRILNRYEPHQINSCKFCGVRLKFYTFELGYGNSNNNICKTCIPNHCGFGVSKVSQKLFKEVYNNLSIDNKNKCKYHELNGEFIIYIDPKDHVKFAEYESQLNKHKYHIDFILEDKIIEFDGTYWHKNNNMDVIKDIFLRHRGYKILRIDEKLYYENPKETLQKCLTFLNQ